MKRFDQINMVPFIDIVLVLLAIVMTTASFISKGLIEVDLPETETSEAIQSDRQYKEIAIKGDNAVFYDGKPIDFIALGKTLNVLPKDTNINLRVDKKAEFDVFMKVVDALKKLELKKVAIESTEAS